MNKIKNTMNNKKVKKWIYIVCAAVLAGWVVARFAAVASENARYVFNASRVAADSGLPVLTVRAERSNGVIRDPVAVRNNRAYVSAAHARQLRAGQKIGNGKIVSVSGGVDFDSGMYIVRTSGVDDGLQYAEFAAYGYFVPTYAVNSDSVFVAVDGVATLRSVKVSRQDSDNAFITSGLNEGDIIILSQVEEGTKVQIAK